MTNRASNFYVLRSYRGLTCTGVGVGMEGALAALIRTRKPPLAPTEPRTRRRRIGWRARRVEKR